MSEQNTVADLRCPQCGCPPCYVMMLAEVKCLLYADGSVGKTVHVGRRVGDRPTRYVCCGGHTFTGPDAYPQEGP